MFNSSVYILVYSNLFWGTELPLYFPVIFIQIFKTPNGIITLESWCIFTMTDYSRFDKMDFDVESDEEEVVHVKSKIPMKQNIKPPTPPVAPAPTTWPPVGVQYVKSTPPAANSAAVPEWRKRVQANESNSDEDEDESGSDIDEDSEAEEDDSDDEDDEDGLPDLVPNMAPPPVPEPVKEIVKDAAYWYVIGVMN